MIRGHIFYISSTIAFFLKAFFRNFAIKMTKLLCLGKKKKQVSLFCARLFVTLPTNSVYTNYVYNKCTCHIWQIPDIDGTNV